MSDPITSPDAVDYAPSSSAPFIVDGSTGHPRIIVPPIPTWRALPQYHVPFAAALLAFILVVLSVSLRRGSFSIMGGSFAAFMSIGLFALGISPRRSASAQDRL